MKTEPTGALSGVELFDRTTSLLWFRILLSSLGLLTFKIGRSLKNIHPSFLREGDTLNSFLRRDGNFIHPTAVLDHQVEMGSNNYIGPYCVITGPVKIGNNNRFESFCCIGAPPEHKSYVNKPFASVEIANDCVFREFVRIHSGTIGNTLILNRVWVLNGAYIAHDSTIHDDVTISGNTQIGGHTEIFRGANIGLNVSIHQYSRIGHFSMLGMSTVVTKKSLIEPFNTYAGNPARFLKRNLIGIKKNNLTDIDIQRYSNEFLNSLKIAV